MNATDPYRRKLAEVVAAYKEERRYYAGGQSMGWSSSIHNRHYNGLVDAFRAAMKSADKLLDGQPNQTPPRT